MALATAAMALGWIAVSPASLAAETEIDHRQVDSDTPWQEKQKLREESTAKKIAFAPARILTWPVHRLADGMEGGLVYVEDNHVLLRFANFKRSLAHKGIFPRYGGLPDGSGFGGGVLLRHRGRTPREHYVSFNAGASIKNFHEYELAYGAPTMFGPLGTRASAFYQNHPQEDFFGIGRDSNEDDRTTYRQETIGAALALALKTGGGMALNATGRIRRINIMKGTDPRFPTTQELFSSDDLPGLGRGANIASFEGGFSYDPAIPERGSRASLSAGVFKAVDGQHLGYLRYRAEMIRLVTLYPGRILAFRALGVITDRRRITDSAAFFDLPELGGSTSMRGFREHRFRDRDAALFNLEYRWQLFGGMDAVLLADEGQVFDNLEDEFRFSALRTSYGGGFRLKSRAGVFMRYEVGHSQEGTRHFIKFDQGF